MTPQEREVIDGIFERLKQAATQQRDPDAEKHIADLMRTQPYAPYVMAQSLFVQEQALANLQQQVQQLQAEVQHAQQAQQQQQSGGFLSGLFGGAAARPAPAARPQAFGGPQQGMAMQPGGMPMQGEPPQGGPWGGAAAQPQQRQGAGFLGTALTTAAGVAGGMVVGNMLMNAFKGSGSQTSNSGLEPVNQPSAAAAPTGESSQDYAAYDSGEAQRYDASHDQAYDDGYDSGDDSYDV